MGSNALGQLGAGSAANFTVPTLLGAGDLAEGMVIAIGAGAFDTVVVQGVQHACPSLPSRASSLPWTHCCRFSWLAACEACRFCLPAFPASLGILLHFLQALALAACPASSPVCRPISCCLVGRSILKGPTPGCMGGVGGRPAHCFYPHPPPLYPGHGHGVLEEFGGIPQERGMDVYRHTSFDFAARICPPIVWV